jgi:hypothetical protein
MQKESYYVSNDIFKGNILNYSLYEPGWTLPSFQPTQAWEPAGSAAPPGPLVRFEAMRMQESVQSPVCCNDDYLE